MYICAVEVPSESMAYLAQQTFSHVAVILLDGTSGQG